MEQYFKFDYFSTPTSDLWYNGLNLEQYGLTSMEVYDYIKQMEKDREKWYEKRKKFTRWGLLLQIVVSIAIPFILILIKYEICVLLDIYDTESIINNIISIIAFLVFLGLEIYIWVFEIISGIYDIWLEKKYKKRTQYNSVIEKLLDDANFEHWKYVNEQERLHTS